MDAVRPRRSWLVLRAGEACLCLEHAGGTKDIAITARPGDLYEPLAARMTFRDAMERDALRVDGPADLVRALPRWLRLVVAGRTTSRRPALASVSR